MSPDGADSAVTAADQFAVQNAFACYLAAVSHAHYQPFEYGEPGAPTAFRYVSWQALDGYFWSWRSAGAVSRYTKCPTEWAGPRPAPPNLEWTCTTNLTSERDPAIYLGDRRVGSDGRTKMTDLLIFLRAHAAAQAPQDPANIR